MYFSALRFWKWIRGQLTYKEGGGTQVLTISSTGETWVASVTETSVDWLTLTPDLEAGTLSVSADAFTGSQRKATVLVDLPNAEDLSAEVSVIQNGELIFFIDPSSTVEVNANSGDEDIRVRAKDASQNAAIDWTAEEVTDVDWITGLTKADGKLRVTRKANVGNRFRKTKLRVSLVAPYSSSLEITFIQHRALLRPKHVQVSTEVAKQRPTSEGWAWDVEVSSHFSGALIFTSNASGGMWSHTFTSRSTGFLPDSDSPVSSKKEGEEIHITLAQNPNAIERKATLKLTIPQTDREAWMYITQKAKPEFTLSGSSLSVGPAAGSYALFDLVTLELKGETEGSASTYLPWVFSSSNASSGWVSISRISAPKFGSSTLLNPKTVKATFTKNTTGEDRVYTFDIHAKGDALVDTTITVTQTSQTFSFSPASLSVSAVPGSQAVAVTSFVGEWSATTTDSWLKMTPSQDKTTLTVSYEENTGGARTGTISFSKGNTVLETYSITQEAPGLVEVLFEAIEDTNALQVTKVANKPWEYNIRIAPQVRNLLIHGIHSSAVATLLFEWKNGTESYLDFIAFDADEEDPHWPYSTKGRSSSEIFISWPKLPSGWCEFTIKGSSDPLVLRVTNDLPDVSVPSYKGTLGATFPPEGGTQNVTIDLSNAKNETFSWWIDWSSVSPSDWAQIEKIDSNTLKVTCSPNTGNKARSHSPYIMSLLYESTPILIKQSTSSVSLSATSENVSAAAGSTEINVTATGGDWSATTTDTWLTLTPSQDKTKLTIDYEKNTENAARTGTVSFKIGSRKLETFTLKQKVGNLTLSTYSIDVEAGTSDTTIEVSSDIDAWTTTEVPDVDWITLEKVGTDKLKINYIAPTGAVDASRTATIRVSDGVRTKSIAFKQLKCFKMDIEWTDYYANVTKVTQDQEYVFGADLWDNTVIEYIFFTPKNTMGVVKAPESQQIPDWVDPTTSSDPEGSLITFDIDVSRNGSSYTRKGMLVFPLEVNGKVKCSNEIRITQLGFGIKINGETPSPNKPVVCATRSGEKRSRTFTVTQEEGTTWELKQVSPKILSGNHGIVTSYTKLSATSFSIDYDLSKHSPGLIRMGIYVDNHYRGLVRLVSDEVAWECSPVTLTEVGALAGDTTIDLSANYEITTTDSWLTLTKNQDNTKLKVAYEENTGSAVRTGSISLKKVNAKYNSGVFTVIQAGAVPAGLIPVSTLEQLNAIRYDLNGDGKVDAKGSLADIAAAETAYEEVFPNVVYESGNTAKYTGYELTKNLDFNTDASYSNATTNKPKWSKGNGTGIGWVPIGFWTSDTDNARFTGAFDGQKKTISNLFINRGSTSTVGLFGYVGSGGSVKNVGLEDPVVTGRYAVGGLVGMNSTGGTISASYVSGGTVTGRNTVGGLVGYNGGGNSISASYVSGATVTGDANAGGLVGMNSTGGTISASYVSGATVTGDANAGGLVGTNIYSATISASYVSGGTVTGDASVGNYGVGGLVGDNSNSSTIIASYVSGGTVTGTGNNSVGSLVGDNSSRITACYAGGKDYANLVGEQNGTVTDSYYQAETTQDGDDETNDVGARTASELKAPTGYSTPPNNIYANWNLDLNSDNTNDDPWHFGTNAQYPVLKIDFDKDNSTADDVTAQRN